MKQNLLKVILLVIFLQTISADQALDLCNAQCYTDSSCTIQDSNNECNQAIVGLITDFYSFTNDSCNDLMYAQALDQDQSTKKTAYIGCMQEYSTSLPSGTKQTYLNCSKSCYENSSTFQVTDEGELYASAGAICLVESIQKTTNCKIDSDCYNQYILSGYIQIKLTMDYDITECDEYFGKEEFSTATLNSSDFETLLSSCYTKLSEKLVEANTSAPNTYPSELEDIFNNIVQCVVDYDMDLRGDEDEDEDPLPQNCSQGYCIQEFTECLDACNDQCGEDNACLGTDLDYLSFIDSQECKDYMEDLFGMISNNMNIDDDFRQVFQTCGDTFTTQYPNNSGLATLMTCYTNCKVEPVEPEDDKKDFSQILSLSAILFVSLILLF